MKVVIPGELPGLNEIIEAARKNKLVSAKQKKEYTNMVAWIVKKLPQMACIDLDIVWVCKDKRRDKDNIRAGIKFILDGLVEAGVIKNDGWKEINNIRESFTVDKKNPRIEIEVKEVLNR